MNPLLEVGSSGQRVRDLQWQLSGHNRYLLQTYRGAVDGVFGAATGAAVVEMKRRIGYPAAAWLPVAGDQLRSYLLPKGAEGAQPRPLAYVIRARLLTKATGYPLASKGPLIGMPYQGTHTLGNWESDRACDIAVPAGTHVLACFSGTIGSQFGPLSSTDPHLLGLRLHLEGASDEAYYAHLRAFATGIAPGVEVVTGQLLGYSGVAAGVAHLHFALEHGWPPTFLADV